MDGIKREFLERTISRGVTEETARQIFDWISSFAAYGFSAAHAASFSELSYASAYMRTHYPAEYFASLLNSQPMGFYSPRVLLNEARRAEIAILPPDIRLSGEGCTVVKFAEGGSAIRVGLSYCKGLSRKSVDGILAERMQRPFASVADLYHRTPVDARALSNLIEGGFLDSLGPPLSGGRRELLDAVSHLPKGSQKRKGDVQRELAGSLTCGVGSRLEEGWWQERPGEGRIASLPFPPGEEERMQRAVLSLDVAEHPLRPHREELKHLKVTPAKKLREMPSGSRVRAAGIMECLQSPPTKSGRSVYFLLLEDESGLLQATIFSDVHQRYGHHLYRAASFLLEGAVEQDDRRGFSFVVDKIENLGALLPQALERHGSVSGSGAMLRAPKPSNGKPAKRTRAS
jgi:error-prone DNA polymerase